MSSPFSLQLQPSWNIRDPTYCAVITWLLDQEILPHTQNNSPVSKMEITPSRDLPKALYPRPELANLMASDDSTAELAASSPRYRRRSSTFIDGIHDVEQDKSQMAPAQLYSTESGRLFHSGRIAIVLVGLPARGKT